MFHNKKKAFITILLAQLLFSACASRAAEGNQTLREPFLITPSDRVRITLENKQSMGSVWTAYAENLRIISKEGSPESQLEITSIARQFADYCFVGSFDTLFDDRDIVIHTSEGKRVTGFEASQLIDRHITPDPNLKIDELYADKIFCWNDFRIEGRK